MKKSQLSLLVSASLLASAGLVCFVNSPVKPVNGVVIPSFEDVSQKANLTDTMETFGAAAANLTDDPFPDLVISRHWTVTVHRNLNGTFLPPDSLGRDFRDTHGVACADFDNDGLVDLLVATGADKGYGVSEKEVYINRNGALERLEKPHPLIADLNGRGRSIVPMDLNKDGLMDFFMANFVQKDRPHRIALGLQEFNSFSELPDNGILSNAAATAFLPVTLFNDNREFIVFQGNGTEAGMVLQMLPDASFVDVTKTLGLHKDGFIRKIIPFDYDNDGDLDLFCIKSLRDSFGNFIKGNELIFKYNAQKHDGQKAGFILTEPPFDFMLHFMVDGKPRPAYLSLGRDRVRKSGHPGGGYFINTTSDLISGNPNVNPAVDEGCFLWKDEAGSIHFECVCKAGKLNEIAGFAYFNVQNPPNPANITDIGLQKQTKNVQNVFYKNEGGNFTKLPGMSMEGGSRAFDAVAEDFNNDGYLDLYVVNGGDFVENPPNSLFLNQGNGTFKEVAKEAGVEGPDWGKGNGCVPIDYDQDGDLDLVIYNGFGTWPKSEGPLMLLENQLNRKNFVEVTLKATKSNSQAWGARLLFYSGGKVTYRQKLPSNSCLSTSDLPIHQGLGEHEKLDSLKVIWPSGIRTNLRNIPAGTRLTIQEGN